MKKIVVSLFIISCYFVFPLRIAHANIPNIEGYVLVSGTNAPVPNVWVKLTNNAAEESNCPAGTINQSRYAKTDANGRYTFVSWTADSDAVGEGKSIDSDFDGKTDVVQYPTFDSCEPGDSPGSIFSCGRDPFAFEVIRPVSLFGTFDSIAKTDAQGNCLFCINNGTFTATAPTLYYHPPKGTNTVTPVASKSPTVTPFGTGSPSVSTTRIPSSTPTRSVSVTGTITPTTGGPSSCSFTSVPATKDIRIATPEYLSIGVSQTGGTVDQITFTSDNGSVVSVCRSPLCSLGSSTYTSSTAQTGLTGFVVGQSTRIHITGKMLSTGTTCTPADITVRVTDSLAWCQFKNTDVVTNGSISCQIPTTCTVANGCTNSLITFDSTQAPGVATAQSSVSPGSGVTSKKPPFGWSSQSSYKGIRYDYGYFDKKTDGITFNNITFPQISSVSDLTTRPTQEGYTWAKYTGGGSLEITNDINVGSNKIVLFVHNADLIIRGVIHVTKGKGLFMVIADGNILVDSSVSGSAGADIEGIYFTDKQLKTGSAGTGSDNQLRMRGVFVAMDKIVLERSLSNNSLKPGEFIEFGQDQLMLFPARLGERNLTWKEIAP
jgi:hypothetical protein